jgi:hypothetical protein
VNRIPVLNDEQRAGYGAPTTEVSAGVAAIAAEAGRAAMIRTPPVTKAPAKKKPAAKAKAKAKAKK